MLPVQTFLIKQYEKLGSTQAALDCLKEQYGINYTLFDVCVSLKYNHTNSPRYNTLVDDCRGLILTHDFKEILSRPYSRFYNYNEDVDYIKTSFKLDRSIVTSKEDGTLIQVWYNKFSQKWEAGTQQNPFGTNYSGKHTFHELFINTIGGEDKLNDLSNLPIDPIIHSEQTNKVIIKPEDCTFLFELCTMENRVLIDYEKPKVFFLDVRSKIDTIEGYSYVENKFDIGNYLINKCSWNINNPEVFTHAFSITSLVNLLNNSQTLIEGVVCYDVYSGVRVKIKTDKYVELAYLANNANLLSTKKLIQLIESGGDVEEFNAYSPERANIYIRTKIGIDDACKLISLCYRELEDNIKMHQLDGRKQYEFVQNMDIPECFKGIVLNARKYGVIGAWQKAPMSKKEEMVTCMIEANKQGSSILG